MCYVADRVISNPITNQYNACLDNHMTLWLSRFVSSYMIVLSCDSPQLTLQCPGKKKAPRKMSREFATNNHEFAYLIPADLHCVYRYKWSTEEWDVLPPCPYHDCALVSIDGALVAVGGENGSIVLTNY